MNEPDRDERIFVGGEVDEEQYEQLMQLLNRKGLTVEEWLLAKIEEQLRLHEQESGKPPQ